jgi:tRNA pseudouridine38-40 synthase
VRNIRLFLEYDGTDYSGWQTQPNGPTIQETLERALATMLGGPARVTGSGRTDAGVHAEGQVANFRTDRAIPLKGFVLGLNSLLPLDISVRRAEEVEDDFDSRRSARQKTYRYAIHNGLTPSALSRRTTAWVSVPLDADAMDRAAAPLRGVHDFEAFRSSGCDAEHAVREVLDTAVRRAGERVQIEITGTGFLRHMVRIIAGTLIEVGTGRRGEDSLARCLASRERGLAGPTAPARGLTLVRVAYDAAPLEGYPS